MNNFDYYLKLRKDLKSKASLAKADIYTEALRAHDGYLTKAYKEGLMFFKDEFTSGVLSEITLDQYDDKVDYSKLQAVDAKMTMFLDLEKNQHNMVIVDEIRIPLSEIWDWRCDY